MGGGAGFLLSGLGGGRGGLLTSRLVESVVNWASFVDKSEEEERSNCNLLLFHSFFLLKYSFFLFKY